MKHKTMILLLMLLSTTLFAQKKESAFKKFYVEAGTGPANLNGAFVELGASAVLKNNWTASFTFHRLDMNPKNLPSNYEQGFTLLIIFPVMDEMPSAKMSLFNFTGGKFFQLGRKTWITTEAGLSVVSGEKVSFTSKQVRMEGLHFSSNYSTVQTSETTIGAMIKSDFNWAFTPYVGLSVGGFANLNSIQSPVGVEIKLIAGWLNTKKKAKG